MVASVTLSASFCPLSLMDSLPPSAHLSILVSVLRRPASLINGRLMVSSSVPSLLCSHMPGGASLVAAAAWPFAPASCCITLRSFMGLPFVFVGTSPLLRGGFVIAFLNTSGTRPPWPFRFDGVLGYVVLAALFRLLRRPWQRLLLLLPMGAHAPVRRTLPRLSLVWPCLRRLLLTFFSSVGGRTRESACSYS